MIGSGIMCVICLLIGVVIGANKHEYLLGEPDTSKEIDKVYIGDILDDYGLAQDIELELSYDVFEIVYSIRMNPLSWKVTSTDYLKSKDWTISYYKNLGKIGFHSICKNGHYDEKKYKKDLSYIDIKALEAQRIKLIEFYDSVETQNVIMGSGRIDIDDSRHSMNSMNSINALHVQPRYDCGGIFIKNKTN